MITARCNQVQVKTKFLGIKNKEGAENKNP